MGEYVVGSTPEEVERNNGVEVKVKEERDARLSNRGWQRKLEVLRMGTARMLRTEVVGRASLINRAGKRAVKRNQATWKQRPVGES